MCEKALFEIGDNDMLFRRIKNLHINEIGEISEEAYKLRENNNIKEAYVSVNLERLCTADETLNSYKNYSVGTIQVAIPRKKTLGVQHCPRKGDEPHKDSHVSITGYFTDEKSIFLANNTVLVINNKG